MRVSNLAEFLEEDELTDEDERDAVHQQFPYVLVVEGDYPEFDDAVRWCWLNLGPIDGRCWSYGQHPVCPIVLATERIEERIVNGEALPIKIYDRVDEHFHKGDWTLHWLGKTDYDHGFGEFCFNNEAQLARFAREVSKFV